MIHLLSAWCNGRCSAQFADAAGEELALLGVMSRDAAGSTVWLGAVWWGFVVQPWLCLSHVLSSHTRLLYLTVTCCI